MLRFILGSMLLVSSLAIADLRPLVRSSANPRSSVTVLSIESCWAFGHEVECQTLEVLSEDLPPRELTLRCYRNSSSLGALILTTGGTGTSYYTDFGPEAELTIETAYANGLALYGLDDYIDMAILSGGPPVADLKRAVFGEIDDPARWPDGLMGFWFTDYLMGWVGNGDYCVNRYVPPEMEEMVHTALDSVSLVSPNAIRDFDHATRIHFVQSDDETHADEQAALYFDALSCTKYWHFIGEITDHAVPGTAEGAGKIRQILLDELGGSVAVGEVIGDRKFIHAYPNPFHRSTSISFDLPHSSVLRLSIFSVDGRRIRSLGAGEYPAGEHRFEWDGRDDGGHEMKSGVYFLRAESGSRLLGTKPLTLLR